MRPFISLIIAAAVIGCARKPAPTVTAPAMVAEGTKALSAADPNGYSTGPASKELLASDAPADMKEKMPRYGDAAVYVDGKMIAAIRATELPSSLKPATAKVVNGAPVIRYGIPAYLTSLGIDLAKVRAVHLHGSRVSMISGDDLRAVGDRMRFAFTAGDRGKPRALYAPTLHLNTRIDIIRSLAVYVDKAPPVEDRLDNLVYADGTRVEGVPYAPAEQGHGTRVYVDGQLVSLVKRKALTNDLLATNDLAKPEFSLKAFLEKNGVDTKQAKSIDLVSNDDIIAHEKSAKGLTFTVPPRNQGLAQVEIEGKPVKLSAVQVFVKTKAPTRAITPISELSPSQPSQGDGNGASQEDH